MGARSGNNYLSTLKKLGAEVWFEGDRVLNVTSHELLGIRGRSLASLYDLQMEKPEAMTFRTGDGGRAGMSFIQPRSREEVRKRGRMMKAWADYGCGMTRDTPDVGNVALAAMSAASGFFADSDRRHGENLERYYREACDRDWCICLGLQGADVGAITPDEPGSGQPLRIAAQTNEGLVVEGRCWAGSLLPLCEEILVLPSRASRQDGAPLFASAFAIPSNIRGLRLIASWSPSRTADINCVATFENVLVPWQRVFLCRDADRARSLARETGVTVHRAHQTAARSLASGEFMVGLAVLVGEAMGTKPDDAVSQRIAAMTAAVEKMQAELQRAEAHAVADRWGICAPAPDAFEQIVSGASRLQSELGEIVRLTNAVPISPAGTGHLKIAIEVARKSEGKSRDTSVYPASLKAIVERASEFIARLN